MNDDLAERLLDQLRLTQPFFDLPATTRPMNRILDALNRTLLALRMPLYHVHLKKPAPKPKDRAAAVKCGMALLGSFAFCTNTRQAIITTWDGHPRSISFQPRPQGLNWNVPHCIYIPTDAEISAKSAVETEDMLFLAPKIACAVGGYQAGQMPDLTATFSFGFFEPGDARVIIREDEGRTHEALFKVKE